MTAKLLRTCYHKKSSKRKLMLLLPVGNTRTSIKGFEKRIQGKRLQYGPAETDFYTTLSGLRSTPTTFTAIMAHSMTTLEYCNMPDRLARDAKEHNPKIICRDYNAWAEKWESGETNE